MPFHPDAVTELRAKAGLSCFELAKRLGCTTQTVINLEQGRNRPSIRLLDSLNRLTKELKLRLKSMFYTAPD